MSYEPNVNDYVKWNKEKHSVEGWVYYKDSEYITIETSVKCKDPDNINDCPIHQKTHTLVLCFPEYYYQLEYVKCRQHQNE